MDIRLLKTEADYEWALSQIEEAFDAAPGTAESDRLEVLVTLVEDYEESHFPVPLPDPIEALKFRMEAQGLTRSDLEPLIGSRARVSEVLNKKRHLSLEMIRNLERGLGIPSSVLIQPYDLMSEAEEIPLSADPDLLEGLEIVDDAHVVTLPPAGTSIRGLVSALLNNRDAFYLGKEAFAASAAIIRGIEVDLSLESVTPAAGVTTQPAFVRALTGNSMYLDQLSLKNTETWSGRKEIAR
jgi:HTH-type transcriptional regulator/antitoxin HigA